MLEPFMSHFRRGGPGPALMPGSRSARLCGTPVSQAFLRLRLLPSSDFGGCSQLCEKTPNNGFRRNRIAKICELSNRMVEFTGDSVQNGSRCVLGMNLEFAES